MVKEKKKTLKKFTAKSDAPKDAKTDHKAIAQKKKEKRLEYNKIEATEENRSALRHAERHANAFSWHYNARKPSPPTLNRFGVRRPPVKVTREEEVCESALQRQIAEYTHYDAINFAAETRIWSKKPKYPMNEHSERVSHHPMSLPTSTTERSIIKAYYRVISDNTDTYTLMACHANVHGFHRGDLRFVEVNDRTIVNGIVGKSIIGNLFLGDIVAVTKLNLISNKTDIADFAINAFRVHQDSPRTWEVAKMTIMARKWHDSLLFALLNNGLAAAKDFDEPLTVSVADKEKPLIRKNVDELYRGKAFIPEKIRDSFAQNYRNDRKFSLIAKASDLPSYPQAFGTIFEFKMSQTDTEMFEIGTNAYTNNVENTALLISGETVYKAHMKSYLQAKIVETCALMGYSAANVVLNGRSDCRSFQMQKPTTEGQIVRFSIPNPEKQPTVGRWKTNNRIKFDGLQGKDRRRIKINAAIETAIADPEKKVLYITARISRASPKNLNFRDDVFIVSQRETPDGLLLKNGFFNDLDPKKNGRRIIQTLYGGAPIPAAPADSSHRYVFPSGVDSRPLNPYQNQYVSMLIHDQNPLVVASAPFGCGKSMTIVTAALEKQKLLKNYGGSHRMQLLVTQSNYASVNLVDIAGKCDPAPKFVRFISEYNWKELPENCLTEYDLPVLMRAFFAKMDLEAELDSYDLKSKTVIKYVITERLRQPDSLGKIAKRIYNQMLNEVKPPKYRELLEAMFCYYKPDIIMTTADSLQNLLATNVLESSDISTIQIDEASQVPEYTLLNLLAKFPEATFGLIGDIHQLPPYCEEDLKGKLKQYGIGNTMERAVHGKLFPQATLRYVYRCHPKTTELLSELFYDEELISGITEDMRNEFMTKSPRTFWPNPAYPMIIVDNQEPGHRMGTSCGNKTEVQMVKQIVEYITKPFPNGYSIPPKDVGVISFYSAQTSVLTEAMRGSGVKCGTVDSFQGSEREVIILCCTNEKISEFMQIPNRLNVAMSRARQATIVIGDLNGLKDAKFWSTVVERAEQSGNLVDMNKHPFCLQIAKKRPENGKKKTEKPPRVDFIGDKMKALNVGNAENSKNPEKKKKKPFQWKKKSTKNPK